MIAQPAFLFRSRWLKERETTSTAQRLEWLLCYGRNVGRVDGETSRGIPPDSLLCRFPRNAGPPAVPRGSRGLYACHPRPVNDYVSQVALYEPEASATDARTSLTLSRLTRHSTNLKMRSSD